ncbi:hypothetical protein D9M72_292310 [compost metagenome]
MGDVDAIECDAPRIELVEPHHEVDQRGLAGAGGADDCHGMPGLGREGQILDQGLVRRITEGHMLELHVAVGLGGQVLGGGLGILLLRIQEFEDTLRGGHAGLQHIGHARHLSQRLGELPGVLDERGGVAQAHAAGSHPQAAHHCDANVAEVGEELHDRHDHAGDELGSETGLVEGFIPFVEAFQHVRVTAEHAHQVVAGERFLDLAVELAGVLPLRGEQLLASRADDAGCHAGQRQGHQGDEGQLPRHDEHHDHNADHSQRGTEQLREGLLQRLLDVVDVIGDTGKRVTALAGVEVVQRQPVELFLGIVTQFADHTHHQHVQDVALQPGENVRHEVHHQHNADEERQLLEVDPHPRNEFHLGDHVREVVFALGAQPVDELVLADSGGQLFSHHSPEDDVHGLPQDLGGNDVEDDGDRHHGQHDGDTGGLGFQQTHQALGGGPEVLCLLRGRPAEHVAVGLGGLVLLFVEIFVFRGNWFLAGGEFFVGAHATSSAVSCDSTISW